MQNITQTLVRQQRLQQELDLSRSGLYKLLKNDPTFPRPVKLGTSIQAPVFYVRAEVEAWLETHMHSREKSNPMEATCDS